MGEKFVDNNGKSLEEGFYYDHMFVDVLYFTGQYSGGLALCESKDGNKLISLNKARTFLFGLRNPNEYLQSQTSVLEWMEKKLGLLEKSAQTPPSCKRKSKYLSPEERADFAPL